MIHDNINVKTDNAEINIYPALKKSYSQSNDYSIIVSINYGKYKFLFAGDAKERLAEFINSNNEKYTLVKMPHHGKINSLSEKFIKSISPSYSIIGHCQMKNCLDEDTIKLLNKYNVKNFLTKDGEIVVKNRWK